LWGGLCFFYGVRLLKFSLEVVFDYEGYPDYYRGHGDTFIDKNVLACIRFGFPITYLETVEDIIGMVLEDINRQIDPIEFLNDAENSREIQEQIEEFLTDENIKQAILETIPEGVKPTDRFFDITPEEEKEIQEQLKQEHLGFIDSPLLIGYIHVWREENDP
jgi:hypothetical protein